jgi:thiamine kinase-like enzyme
MDKIIQKYDLSESQICKNNYNTTICGYSNALQKKVFIKIFAERDKYENEKQVCLSMISECGFIDSNDDETYYIVYAFRNYKDIVINKRNIREIAALIADFHKTAIAFNKPSEMLSHKLIRSMDEIRVFLTDKKLEDIYDKISSYFDFLDIEERLIGEVTVHGDFGTRNIKECDGKLYLIDFERAGRGCFWLDFNKFFNREIKNPNSKKTFLEAYSQAFGSKFLMPASLYRMAQLFYSVLGVYKYNHRFSDPEFFGMGQKMLKKVENYFSDMRIIN